MQVTESRLLDEVQRFRTWAASRPHHEGAWECDYKAWSELREAVVSFLDAVAPEEWRPATTEALLYAIARDWDIGSLAYELKTRPRHLRAAVQAAVNSTEADAKWQLARALTDVDAAAAHPILETLAFDGDEYVSRRALLDLGRIRSPLVEQLADRAWATGHEYQRIAAIQALHEIDSPRLNDFLALAEQDGREYLGVNARRIRLERTTRSRV
jgi:HEAT repeat protein